jgi:hypothetical protein
LVGNALALKSSGEDSDFLDGMMQLEQGLLDR